MFLRFYHTISIIVVLALLPQLRAATNPVDVVDINTDGQVDYCVGTQGLAVVTVTVDFTTGEWRAEPATALDLLTLGADTLLFTGLEVGPVLLWYVAADPDGDGPCVADSLSISLNLQEITVTHEVVNIDCYSAAPRAIINVAGATDYTISGPSGTLVSGDTIIVGNVGSYEYTVTAGVCTTTQTFTVEDLRYDETAPAETISVTAGEPFTIDIPDGFVPDAILWNVDGDVTLDVPSLTLDITGETITVDLTLMEGDCSARWQYILVPQFALGRPLKFFLPNVIRPDGPNENFTLPPGSPYTMINIMEIYDRWGNTAYRIDNAPAAGFNGWNGKMDGRNVVQGVYVYYLQATRDDGAVQTAFGSLTVLH
jgi:hypothetical protein